MLEELIDRFGEPPKKVQQLLMIASLKALAHQAYITAVEQKGDALKFVMYEKAKIRVQDIPVLLKNYGGRLSFKMEELPYFEYRENNRKTTKKKDEEVLEQVRLIINDIRMLAEN